MIVHLRNKFCHTSCKRRHFANDGNFSARELEADRFSGVMLYRMGATVIETQSNVFNMAQANEAARHPGQSRRLVVIEEGWVAGETVAR